MPKTKKTTKKVENSEEKVPRQNVKKTPKVKNTEPLKKQPGRKAKKNTPKAIPKKKEVDTHIVKKTPITKKKPVKKNVEQEFRCGTCERDLSEIQTVQ
jgi:protein-disulfide isomerase